MNEGIPLRAEAAAELPIIEAMEIILTEVQAEAVREAWDHADPPHLTVRDRPEG